MYTLSIYNYQSEHFELTNHYASGPEVPAQMLLVKLVELLTTERESIRLNTRLNTWLLSKLTECRESVNRALSEYGLGIDDVQAELRQDPTGATMILLQVVSGGQTMIYAIRLPIEGA